MSELPEEMKWGDVLLHVSSGVLKFHGVYANNWKKFQASFTTNGFNEPERRPDLVKGESVKITMFDRRTIALVKTSREDREPFLGHIWQLTLEISEHDFPFSRDECRDLGWEQFVLEE